MKDCYFKVSAWSSLDVGDAEAIRGSVPLGLKKRERDKLYGSLNGKSVSTWCFCFDSTDAIEAEKARGEAESKAARVRERLGGQLALETVRISFVTSNPDAHRRLKRVA